MPRTTRQSTTLTNAERDQYREENPQQFAGEVGL